MSSRETTREEPAKSGGEGSLQTLADGSGIMGHGICRAATSGVQTAVPPALIAMHNHMHL